MQVYFIYKITDTPLLYAITDKKDLKDEFLSTRRKNGFKSVKKDLTKEEWIRFTSIHSSYLLGYKWFKTKDEDGESTDISVVATRKEEGEVFNKSDIVFTELARFVDEEAIKFNNELLSALDVLLYYNVYKWDNTNKGIYNPFTAGVENRFLEYEIDTFNLFLYLFKDTFDNKGGLENGI